MKLKLCETIQKNMAAMGFTPNQQQNHQWQLNSGQCFCIFKYSVDVIATTLYVFREAESVDKYIEAIFTLTVEGGVLIAFVSLMLKNDKIFNIIEVGAEEVTLRSNNSPRSRAIYEKTNQLIEKLSKMIYFAAMRLAVPGLIFPKVIFTYFIYFTTDAGNEVFELLFPASLPFDWKNPIGYFFAEIWAYISAFIVLRFLICMTSLVFAFFLVTFSLTRDWKGDLRNLDEMAKTKHQSETKMFEQLAEFVRSHSNAKQLINDFVDVYELSILADVMCCTITLCVVMMMVQVEILSKDIIDPEVVWKSIFCGSWAFGLIFFSCEVGQQASNMFEDVADRMNHLDWYLFPLKVQRLLPTLIISTQEPITIGCFGIMNGSRDQFKKVVGNVYKFFNVLRNIYN